MRLPKRDQRVRPSRVRTGKPRGQSIVEFALLLPVLLLILMGAIDFGRVFLGWVALNNTARVAANYAASNAPLISAGNVAALARYNDTVQRDAALTNCEPPDPIPAPSYSPNASLGGSATVVLTCDFQLLTPIIANILGGTVEVSATAIFPVRTGIVANVPSGGGGSPPVAAFNVSPSSGDAPLAVAFNNVSSGSIATYAWDFGNGNTSTAKDPPNETYSVPGSYSVSLSVSNGLVTSTATRTVTVTTPPGPIANFDLNPATGVAPLTVAFTNTSTPATGLTYAWVFGNGQTSTLMDPPNQLYPADGTYQVTLTVTDTSALSSSTSKTVTVTVAVPMCVVPDFNGKTSDAMITKWTDAGFVASNLIFSPSRPPEYTVKSQIPGKGTSLACATGSVTVSNK